MALHPYIKEERTGIPTEPPQETEREAPSAAPAPPPVTPPQPNTPAPSPAPVPQPEPAEPPQPPAPAPEPQPLLLSIERQLQSLSKTVLGLEQAIADSRTPDFRAVFDKIDAARASIEKLIPAPDSSQPAEEKETERTDQLLQLLQSVLEKQERNSRQLAQSLRDNATFQIQVRQGMQGDLDKLKEQMNGEQFNPLLKEIASIYVEYQSLLEDESISGRSRQNLSALFEQLADLLNDYDAEIFRSAPGSVRQTRVCKVIGKTPTGQQELHNTIAASRKPGVVRGRTVLYPEFVDVFLFDPALAEAPAEEPAETPAEQPEPAASAAPSEKPTPNPTNPSDTNATE